MFPILHSSYIHYKQANAGQKQGGQRSKGTDNLVSLPKLKFSVIPRKVSRKMLRSLSELLFLKIKILPRKWRGVECQNTCYLGKGQHVGTAENYSACHYIQLPEKAGAILGIEAPTPGDTSESWRGNVTKKRQLLQHWRPRNGEMLGLGAPQRPSWASGLPPLPPAHPAPATPAPGWSLGLECSPSHHRPFP